MEENKLEPVKKRYKLWILIALIIIVIGIVAAVIYLEFDKGKEKNDLYIETVSENTVSMDSVSEGDAGVSDGNLDNEEIIYCDRNEEFEKLAQENNDVYAWIIVPGTKVDYPVLQNETDDYWLDRNLDGSKGYPGCLYTNKINSKDFSDFNTIIYGHNMKNKTMFGSLHSFDDQDFFDENEIFYIYTLDQRYTYEIYSAVRFSNYYIPAFYNLDSEAGKQGYIDMTIKGWQGGSDVDHNREDIEVTSSDKLVTLSTCIGNSDYRFLVVGKLIEEAKYYDTDLETVSENNL